MIISWLSFLIDFTSAPARISLGLLSILTLITQTSTIIQTMPKISYIKAIDVWLFTCLAFVIISLLEFAFINSFCREGPKPIMGFTKKLAMNSLKTMINPTKKQSSEEFLEEKNENDDKNDANDKNVLLKGLKMEKTTGYKIDNAFFILYPIAFCIFNVIYWSIYNRHYVIEK
ncbi:UNVERIFIED_CONTAM: hypothetical protein GTU68_030937 [Idotea baltica]|nr:hypothetical protein [Idotea baltica]